MLGLDPNRFDRDFPDAGPAQHTTYLLMNQSMAKTMTYVDEYREALGLLARRGLVREPSASARDFAGRAATTLPTDAAAAFARLTEDYLACRFGGRARDGSTDHVLAALRRALAAG